MTRGEGDEPGELVKTLKRWTLAGHVQSHIYWSASCVHGPQFWSMSKWLCATLFHFISNSSLLMTLREFSVCFLGTLLLFPTFFTFLLYRNFGFADVEHCSPLAIKLTMGGSRRNKRVQRFVDWILDVPVVCATLETREAPYGLCPSTSANRGKSDNQINYHATLTWQCIGIQCITIHRVKR